MLSRGQPLAKRHRSRERPVFPSLWLAVGVSSSIHAIGVIAFSVFLTNDTIDTQPSLTIQLVRETTFETKTEANGVSPVRPITEFSSLDYKPIFLPEPAPTQQTSPPPKLLIPTNVPVIPTPEIAGNELATTGLATPPSSKLPPPPTTFLPQVKPISIYNTFIAYESLAAPTPANLELETQYPRIEMSFSQIKEPKVQDLSPGDRIHRPKSLKKPQRMALVELTSPIKQPQVSSPKNFSRTSPPAPPALSIHENTFSNLQVPLPVNKDVDRVESLPAKILRETTERDDSYRMASYRDPELGNKPPEHPGGAFGDRLEGRVKIFVTVSADGQPRQVRIEETSGIEVLDHAARKAVEKWRFLPAYRRGIAVDSNVVIPVLFQLEN